MENFKSLLFPDARRIVKAWDRCRIHQTLRVTPAMEADLTDHVWTITELLS